jgi:hypothetical protein
MEKSESRLGVSSTIIGLINPIAFVLMSRSSIAGFLLVCVPIVGILLGVIGLLIPDRTKGFSIAGIILNMLPLGFALLIVVAFKSGSGGWSVNG